MILQSSSVINFFANCGEQRFVVGLSQTPSLSVFAIVDDVDDQPRGMAEHKSKRMQRIQAPTRVFAQSRRAFFPPWQSRGSAERMVLEPKMVAVVDLTRDAGTNVTAGLFLTPGHSHGSASGVGRLLIDLREIPSNA